MIKFSHIFNERNNDLLLILIDLIVRIQFNFCKLEVKEIKSFINVNKSWL